MITDFLQYASAMVGCYAAMPEEEKSALHAWEAVHVDGSGALGTSDWPGWEKYIGKFHLAPEKEARTFGYVYLLRAATGEYKIGKSLVVPRRLAQLQTGSPVELQLIHQFPAVNAAKAERALHKRFVSRLVRSEWFLLTESDVASISAIEQWGANA